MADEKPLVHKYQNQARTSVFIIAAVILLLWVLETPPGLLGKADAIGYAVCHRIDVRSLHIGTRQLPFCARCTGQYIGALIGLLFQVIFSKGRSGFPPRRVIVILAALGLAYAVDGLNSYLFLPPFLEAFPHLPHLYVPSNTLRLLTGSGLGLVISIILYPAFVGSIYTQRDTRPAMSGIRNLSVLVGLCLVVDLLILSGSPFILYPVALISAGGVVILLSFAYTIVILRIFKKENTYYKFSQIYLPLFTGFLLSIAQIAFFDLIRYIMTGTWSGFVFG